jgi:hypothetical protein
MAYPVMRPRIVGARGYDASKPSDNYAERLAKYLPLPITAAYTVLDGYVRDWEKTTTTILSLSPITVEYIGLIALVLIGLGYVHKKYQEARRRSELAPKRIEFFHVTGLVIIFIFWTYLIHSAFWRNLYDPNACLILGVILGAANGLYQPAEQETTARDQP